MVSKMYWGKLVDLIITLFEEIVWHLKSMMGCLKTNNEMKKKHHQTRICWLKYWSKQKKKKKNTFIQIVNNGNKKNQLMVTCIELVEFSGTNYAFFFFLIQLFLLSKTGRTGFKTPSL